MNEQLELIDLGDAMAETKSCQIWGSQFDYLYGPSRCWG